jgi:phage tail-like protein
MPDLMTTFSFAVEIQGVTLGFFKKCSGVESETETIEFKESTKDGKMIIRKVPGAMKWANIVLERRIDTSISLWEWRKQVIDGDVDAARKDGSIVLYDSTHSEVARWNFEAGWPAKWTGAELDASGSDVATESVEIAHEGLVRA